MYPSPLIGCDHFVLFRAIDDKVGTHARFVGTGGKLREVRLLSVKCTPEPDRIPNALREVNLNLLRPGTAIFDTQENSSSDGRLVN